MKSNYKIMAKVIEAVYENGVFRPLEKSKNLAFSIRKSFK
ncbi:MAG TPA: DUF104 domain-containing protein [Nanoarchaeota archaeon]|nr:DUF104 domain-containing protein [Nanoarchaeota archaeon]